ncbi:MAG: hypothetical protein R8G01_01195 [Ilumatobacteraceae bacterium]|nr:hypothetical protein [Ilumatobacteraceae bacterium]
MNKRAIALIGGAVVVVESVLLLTDTGPNIWLVAALVCLAGAAVSFMSTIDRFVARPDPAPRAPASSTSYPDLRTTSLRQALAVGNSDVRHAQRLRDQLVAIIDDELLTVHGIDRHDDPDAARTVLGDKLWRFADDDDTTAHISQRGATHIVTLIERL